MTSPTDPIRILLTTDGSVRFVDAEAGKAIMLPEFGTGVDVFTGILISQLDGGGIFNEGDLSGNLLINAADIAFHSVGDASVWPEPVAVMDDASKAMFSDVSGLNSEFAENLPDDIYLLCADNAGGDPIGLLLPAVQSQHVFDIDYADALKRGWMTDAAFVSVTGDLSGDGRSDAVDLAVAVNGISQLFWTGAETFPFDFSAPLSITDDLTIHGPGIYIDDIIIGAVAADLDGDGLAETLEIIAADTDGDGNLEIGLSIDHGWIDFNPDGDVTCDEASACPDFLFDTGLVASEADFLFV